MPEGVSGGGSSITVGTTGLSAPMLWSCMTSRAASCSTTARRSKRATPLQHVRKFLEQAAEIVVRGART
jgi:hypothetical protein